MPYDIIKSITGTGFDDKRLKANKLKIKLSTNWEKIVDTLFLNHSFELFFFFKISKKLLNVFWQKFSGLINKKSIKNT